MCVRYPCVLGVGSEMWRARKTTRVLGRRDLYVRVSIVAREYAWVIWCSRADAIDSDWPNCSVTVTIEVYDRQCRLLRLAAVIHGGVMIITTIIINSNANNVCT